MPLAHLYRVIQDTEGNAIPGASITITRSDTGAQAALYDDPGGLIPLAQPILSDMQYGSISVYVADGEYDVVPTKTGYVFDVLRRASVQSVQSGTFGVFATGFVDPPTGQATYMRIGRQVILLLPDLVGVSNSTTFTIEGLPSVLECPTQVRTFALITNNAVFGTGLVQIDRLAVTLYATNQLGPWAATGQKGYFQTPIIYLLP